MHKKRQIRKLIYLQNIEIFKNMKLHYYQTMYKCAILCVEFYYHMKLHYSQTLRSAGIINNQFDYHMKLHYSQTCHSDKSIQIITTTHP